MATSYGFHPEALFEYAEATQYYLQEASPEVAERFILAVESAVAGLVSNPERWRVMEEPGIRRGITSRFPFLVYYLWDSQMDYVTIYAVMHASREPGYWQDRLGQNG